MTREVYEEQIAKLQPATDAFARINDATYVRETEKAVCLEVANGVAGSKEIWLPKSQVGQSHDVHFGHAIYVKRSWLTRQRLWWITR